MVMGMSSLRGSQDFLETLLTAFSFFSLPSTYIKGRNVTAFSKTMNNDPENFLHPFLVKEEKSSIFKGWLFFVPIQGNMFLPFTFSIQMQCLNLEDFSTHLKFKNILFPIYLFNS